MKFVKPFLLIVAVLALFPGVTAVNAQSITADANTMLPIEAQNVVLNLLLSLAKVHPWIATVITVLGSARLWVKPLFSLVHLVVDLTPGTTDNGLLDKLVNWFHTPLGSKVAYMLDWAFSIKIIPPTKAGVAQ